MAAFFRLFCMVSLSAGLLALPLMGVRRLLGRRMGAGVLVLLWAMLAARLLVPYFPASPISLFNYAPQGIRTLSRGVQAAGSDIPAAAIQPDASGAEQQDEPPAGAVAIAEAPQEAGQAPTPAQPEPILRRAWNWLKALDPWAAAGYAWLAVAAGLLGWAVFSHMRQRHRLRRCPRREDDAFLTCYAAARAAVGLKSEPPVYEVPGLESPAAFGLLSPCILLPQGLFDRLDNNARRAVLTHECMHIRRGDLLCLAFMLAVRIVHWCNPVLHLACRAARMDIEMFCDRACVRALGGDARGYAGALVDVAAQLGARPSPMVMVAAVEGRRTLLWRMRRILERSRASRALSIVAAALLMAFAIVGCTGAVEIAPLSMAGQGMASLSDVFDVGPLPTPRPVEPNSTATPITLYLGEGHKSIPGAENLAAAQAVVDGAGFPVTLALGPDYTAGDEAQLEYLRQAFAAPGYAAALYPYQYAALEAAGLLEDVRAEGLERAPAFFAQADRYARRSDPFYSRASHVLPAQGRVWANDEVFLLTRGDLQQAFGREVESWEDFKAFLSLARQEDPQAPALLLLPYDVQFDAFYPLYVFYLVSQGYSPYLYSENFAVSPQGELVALETLPVYQDFLVELEALSAADAIVYPTMGATYDAPATYACALGFGTELNDAANMPLRHGVRTLPDFSAYHASLPFADVYRNGYRAYAHYFVVSKGTDASALFDLLETLCADEAFYRRLLLGVEGEDYELRDGGVEYATRRQYARWIDLDILRVDAHEQALRYAHLPEGFPALLSAQPHRHDAAFAALREAAAQARPAHEESLTARQETMRHLREAHYGGESTAFATDAAAWPDAHGYLEAVNNTG